MHLKKTSKKIEPDSTPKAFLNIVGQNVLQNELLLSFLKGETGLKGSCFSDMESIIQRAENESSIPQVFILDCKQIDIKNLWTSIHDCECSNRSPCFFVLFNAEHDPQFEKSALDNNIQGIFYNNDPPKLISKGICAVLNGEIWYSRKILNTLLEKWSSSDSLSYSAVPRLTVKEKQILSFIASGYSSKDMSNELNISMHTVKSHIYNIYKKINATDRLQATFWAMKHLKLS